MRAASSSFFRASSTRQRQRRAPLPGTTSIPVPKQKEQTTGSPAADDTRWSGESLSSTSGATANLWTLEPTDMSLILLSLPFPAGAGREQRVRLITHPRGVFGEQKASRLCAHLAQREINGLALGFKHCHARLGQLNDFVLCERVRFGQSIVAAPDVGVHTCASCGFTYHSVLPEDVVSFVLGHACGFW